MQGRDTKWLWCDKRKPKPLDLTMSGNCYRKPLLWSTEGPEVMAQALIEASFRLTLPRKATCQAGALYPGNGSGQRVLQIPCHHQSLCKHRRAPSGGPVSPHFCNHLHLSNSHARQRGKLPDFNSPKPFLKPRWEGDEKCLFPPLSSQAGWHDL